MEVVSSMIPVGVSRSHGEEIEIEIEVNGTEIVTYFLCIVIT